MNNEQTLRVADTISFKRDWGHLQPCYDVCVLCASAEEKLVRMDTERKHKHNHKNEHEHKHEHKDKDKHEHEHKHKHEHDHEKTHEHDHKHELDHKHKQEAELVRAIWTDMCATHSNMQRQVRLFKFG